jgi:hypothetical protein
LPSRPALARRAAVSWLICRHRSTASIPTAATIFSSTVKKSNCAPSPPRLRVATWRELPGQISVPSALNVRTPAPSPRDSVDACFGTVVGQGASSDKMRPCASCVSNVTSGREQLHRPWKLGLRTAVTHRGPISEFVQTTVGDVSTQTSDKVRIHTQLHWELPAHKPEHFFGSTNSPRDSSFLDTHRNNRFLFSCSSKEFNI